MSITHILIKMDLTRSTKELIVKMMKSLDMSKFENAINSLVLNQETIIGTSE